MFNLPPVAPFSGKISLIVVTLISSQWKMGRDSVPVFEIKPWRQIQVFMILNRNLVL